MDTDKQERNIQKYITELETVLKAIMHDSGYDDDEPFKCLYPISKENFAKAERILNGKNKTTRFFKVKK